MTEECLARRVETHRRPTRTLVKRIISIWFQEQVLQANHDGIQVEDRFPVFTKDVQTHVALEIDIRVVNLRTGSQAESIVGQLLRTACDCLHMPGRLKLQFTQTQHTGTRPRTFCVHLTFGGSCG